MRKLDQFCEKFQECCELINEMEPAPYWSEELLFLPDHFLKLFPPTRHIVIAMSRNNAKNPLELRTHYKGVSFICLLSYDQCKELLESRYMYPDELYELLQGKHKTELLLREVEQCQSLDSNAPIKQRQETRAT